MDYRKLAIDELRNIEQLRAAEKVCRDRLLELNESLKSLKTSTPQSDPVRGGGSQTEERWLNLIAAKMDKERRLKSIQRRLRRFNTAWATLPERDKMVLQIWYIDSGNYDRAECVVNREHCGRATAFRWRDEALINFARAFFGAVVA